MGNKPTDSSSTADFFRGSVHFLEQSDTVARYTIMDNGSIIDVNNGLHIRLIENQFGIFPEVFEIIALLDAVKLVKGEIPSSHIYRLPASEYLRFRMIHHGV